MITVIHFFDKATLMLYYHANRSAQIIVHYNFILLLPIPYTGNPKQIDTPLGMAQIKGERRFIFYHLVLLGSFSS